MIYGFFNKRTAHQRTLAARIVKRIKLSAPEIITDGELEHNCNSSISLVEDGKKYMITGDMQNVLYDPVSKETVTIEHPIACKQVVNKMYLP